MNMSRTRKNHPASFKAKVALYTIREDAPISELASKYGVHATVIHRWKREALASMEAGFSGKPKKLQGDHKAELKELHAKIGQQSVELDFLQDVSNRLGLGDVRK
jgi:transposase